MRALCDDADRDEPSKKTETPANSKIKKTVRRVKATPRVRLRKIVGDGRILGDSFQVASVTPFQLKDDQPWRLGLFVAFREIPRNFAMHSFKLRELGYL
jgi:hypothetical protein